MLLVSPCHANPSLLRDTDQQQTIPAVTRVDCVSLTSPTFITILSSPHLLLLPPPPPSTPALVLTSSPPAVLHFFFGKNFPSTFYQCLFHHDLLPLFIFYTRAFPRVQTTKNPPPQPNLSKISNQRRFDHMGRTDNSSPMEGIAYPHRSSKSANLRRMQSEYLVGSSRPGPSLGSSRPRDSSRGNFWNTVMDGGRPPPSLVPSGSFHAGFPSVGGASSSHVQSLQSFHGSTASSSIHRAGSSRASSSQKRFHCSDCGSSHSTPQDLAAHKQRNHPKQARPFQCDLCGTGFSQRSHLNQHVRTVHDKVKPHKCQQCNKAFGKKYDLISHKDAVHSNERPHHCEFCNKRFAKRSNLTRHKEKLHKDMM